MKFIMKYLRPHYPMMLIGLIIKIIGTVVDLLIPYILSYIIDEVTPKNDISLVVKWGFVMIACAAMVFICNVWANRVAAGVSRDTIEKLRYDLFHKFSYLSSFQVDTFISGDGFGVRWEKGIAVTEEGCDLICPEIGTLYELEF